VSKTDIHPITDRSIPKSEKEMLFGQKGVVFWLCGLSGSGKSTLAIQMEKLLHDKGKHCILLDGDNLRSGLNSDLGFTDSDRIENIRRVSEVAKLLSENGMVVLVSLITPFRKSRLAAKSIIGESNFHEIFVKASFSACKERDVKGLYAKAEAGKVQAFTGKSSAFEEPDNPSLTINTEQQSEEESVQSLFAYILKSISID
jgi:adenylylsulfate kinase